jgi:small conductance mechanosensitive channel
MEEVLLKLQELATIYGIKLIAALVIFIVGRIVAKGVKSFMMRLMDKRSTDSTLSKFAANLVYIAILAFVIIAALGQMGIQTASFVAVIGAAGLAVGLALQGSLANFAAGFLMIIFKPIKVGDYVEGGGIAGIVEEVGIFTTQLRSPDNKRIISPNSKIMGDNIVNYSANDTRRLDLLASVSYSDDTDKAQRILREIAEADERILKDPAPTIGILQFADSSINLAFRPWVKTAEYWDIYFALHEQIKKRFDAEGITIPFPQQDVYIHQTESKEG